jgi:hypothetical protein
MIRFILLSLSAFFLSEYAYTHETMYCILNLLQFPIEVEKKYGQSPDYFAYHKK